MSTICVVNCHGRFKSFQVGEERGCFHPGEAVSKCQHVKLDYIAVLLHHCPHSADYNKANHRPLSTRSVATRRPSQIPISPQLASPAEVLHPVSLPVRLPFQA